MAPFCRHKSAANTTSITAKQRAVKVHGGACALPPSQGEVQAQSGWLEHLPSTQLDAISALQV